ncbi:hypothetical protein RRG08_032339 [Elysia crispata]|uniref:Uncharacterized protein n=1 Tax=Elysia crispata TaxID=231223 RepID=A0AAE1DRM5_9GAST|nr:hypothetical protein RRG08_032339 [Elysia crispata]
MKRLCSTGRSRHPLCNVCYLSSHGCRSMRMWKTVVEQVWGRVGVLFYDDHRDILSGMVWVQTPACCGRRSVPRLPGTPASSVPKLPGDVTSWRNGPSRKPSPSRGASIYSTSKEVLRAASEASKGSGAKSGLCAHSWPGENFTPAGLLIATNKEIPVDPICYVAGSLDLQSCVVFCYTMSTPFWFEHLGGSESRGSEMPFIAAVRTDEKCPFVALATRKECRSRAYQNKAVISKMEAKFLTFPKHPKR